MRGPSNFTIFAGINIQAFFDEGDTFFSVFEAFKINSKLENNTKTTKAITIIQETFPYPFVHNQLKNNVQNKTRMNFTTRVIQVILLNNTIIKITEKIK